MKPSLSVDKLNGLPDLDFSERLHACCGCNRWVDLMLHARPFKDAIDLETRAEKFWREMGEPEFLEAFSHHPRIGASVSPSAQGDHWAAQEQGGVHQAGRKTRSRLDEFNQKYFEKFGFIYLVCATGKSADEMLSILTSRIRNSREQELQIAAQEQGKIMKLRLEKLLKS